MCSDDADQEPERPARWRSSGVPSRSSSRRAAARSGARRAAARVAALALLALALLRAWAELPGAVFVVAVAIALGASALRPAHQLAVTVALLPLVANPLLIGAGEARVTGIGLLLVAAVLARAVLGARPGAESERGAGPSACWLAALAAVALGSATVTAARAHDLLSPASLAAGLDALGALAAAPDPLGPSSTPEAILALVVAAALAGRARVVARDDAGRRALGLALAAALLASAVLALAQVATGAGVAPFGVEVAPGRWAQLRRAWGGWPDANALAAFVLLATPVATAAAAARFEGRRARLAAAAVVGCGALALVASSSRAGALGALVALATAAALAGAPPARRAALALLAAAALSALALVAVARLAPPSADAQSAGSARWMAPLAGRLDAARTGGGRLAYWEALAGSVEERPLFGLGAGALYRQAPRVWSEAGHGGPPPLRNAHSQPLQVAAELGLPGALLFVALLGGALVAAARRQCALAVALAGYAPMLALGHPLVVGEQLWLLALLLGAHDGAPPGPRTRRAAGIAAAIYATAVAAAVGMAQREPPRLALHGAHPLEISPEGALFRWLPRRTELVVAPSERPLELVLASELPVRDRRPLEITARDAASGELLAAVLLVDGRAARMRVPVAGPGRTRRVELVCDRDFRPDERSPASGDHRSLCARLWELSSETAAILPLAPPAPDRSTP